MQFEHEKSFKCPYCFERISMLLDLSEDGSQQYIEDCEVCCQPIQIAFTVEENKLAGFQSVAIQ
jgi:transcription elongation factor Elf1